MTSDEYAARLSRLKEIEACVKDPEFSLDRIDELLEETAKIAAECYAHVRGLKEKISSVNSPQC